MLNGTIILQTMQVRQEVWKVQEIDLLIAVSLMHRKVRVTSLEQLSLAESSGE